MEFGATPTNLLESDFQLRLDPLEKTASSRWLLLYANSHYHLCLRPVEKPSNHSYYSPELEKNMHHCYLRLEYFKKGKAIKKWIKWLRFSTLLPQLNSPKNISRLPKIIFSIEIGTISFSSRFFFRWVFRLRCWCEIMTPIDYRLVWWRMSPILVHIHHGACQAWPRGLTPLTPSSAGRKTNHHHHWSGEKKVPNGFKENSFCPPSISNGC